MRRTSVFIEQIFPSSVALLNGNFTLLCVFPREPGNVNECQAHISLCGWVSERVREQGLLQARMLIRLHLHRRLLAETDNYFAPCSAYWGRGREQLQRSKFPGLMMIRGLKVHLSLLK